MFNLLRRTHGIYRVRALSTHELHLFFLQNQNPFLRLSSISTRSSPPKVKDGSFTVSYLMNTCGLPLKSALSVSKYVNFDTPRQPDSVINLFKSHGFSQTQISIITRVVPRVLILNPEKVLLPKLQFLQSKGVLGLDLVQILLRNPEFLTRSLEMVIVPNYNYTRNLFGSDEKTIAFLKGRVQLFRSNLVSVMPPKIKVLQDIQMSDSNIVRVFRLQPRIFVRSVDYFQTLVEKLRDMGFDPEKSHFGTAMMVMDGMSKCTWEKKVDLYKSWGWTSQEVLEAFKRYPACMATAEEKITVTMDLVVNKMGWVSSEVVKFPHICTASLDNRIRPRVRVLQFLLSKGLIKKNPTLSTTFICSEEQFLQKYVHCYKEGPQLLKLYKENSGLAANPEDLAEGRNLVSAVVR